MTLHEKHMRLLDVANYANTEKERHIALARLYAWRDGLSDAGARLDLCTADLEYDDRGEDRPMCAGVFLDWTPPNS